MKTDETQCCDICTLDHATEDCASIKPIKVKGFRRADLTDAEKSYMSQLWHLSRVENHKTYERMQYVAKWFMVKFPECGYSSKALWLAIETETALIK